MGDGPSSDRAVETGESEKTTGADISSRTYTEEDIRALEGQDLSDPAITTTLTMAYEQNDPEGEYLLGFWPSTTELKYATEAQLRETLPIIESVLERNPKNAGMREMRMRILANLAAKRPAA